MLARCHPSDEDGGEQSLPSRPLLIDNAEVEDRRERDVIKILVAEDHGLMLEAILNRLHSDPDVEVLGAFSDGQALVDAYTQLLEVGTPPDLVLSDQTMPKLSGIEATARLLAVDPRARVLILSAYEDQSMVVAAMAAGAVGYVVKSLPPGELRDKVHAAARGQTVFDSKTARQMMGAAVRGELESPAPEGSGSPLSEREIEVLSLVSEGLSNAEIGRRLFISSETVKTHLERLTAKLGVSGRAAAVRRGIETGAIETH